MTKLDGHRNSKQLGSMFADAKAEILDMLETNAFANFRTREQFFDPYLIEAKATSAAKLRSDWWAENRRTKWGAHGQECIPTPFQKFIEDQGNAIKRLSNQKDPEDMEGLHVKVYWPADNLTRVCKLLKYNKKGRFFTAFYYFCEEELEEHLDTDWEFFPIVVTCPYCDKKVGPVRICPSCKSKMTI